MKPCSKNNDTCPCSRQQGFFFSVRHISIIIASILFMQCATFITGYFLGKKQPVDGYVQQAMNDVLADTIYTSVVSHGTVPEQLATDTISATINDVHTSIVTMDPIRKKQDTVSIDCLDNVTDNHEVDKKYYAELIGFGTEAAALQFVKKLAGRGITVEMKKRTSKTARGKVTFWYQVITPLFESKNEMQAFTDGIIASEKLKNVQIRTC